ncbi:MAG: SDR family NAD(P)-dependent oxidoreductase [Flavobacteriales bacterium]|nr:SDR family NAD(P)-dependent oxidoreductase [Flavobacteriales bacterium]
MNHPNFKNIQADISDIKSVESAYQQTISYFGNDIQILISNAGLGISALFEEIKVAEWHQMFDTNVNKNMMQPEDIADTILHCLHSSPNYHYVDIEVRPLQAMGKR